MYINWIKIENVLSIEKAYINFDNLGNIVHVKGINRDTNPYSSNGSGKSSIPECISLLVRGRSIRPTKLKESKNQYTKGDSVLKGMVNGNILITRHIAPSKLYVEVDGKPYNGESIGDTQAMLDKLLNTNDKVFLSTMLYGQENTSGFITASPSDKREILKSFLNASDIFKNRESVKELKSEYRNNTKVAQSLLSSVKGRIDSTTDKIKVVEGNKKTVEGLLTKECLDFLDNHSLSEIRDIEERYKSLDKDISSSESRLHRINSEIETSTRRVKAIKSYVCDNCGEIPKDSKNELSALNSSLSKLRTSSKELSSSIKKDIGTLSKYEVPISSDEMEAVEGRKGFEKELELLRGSLRELKEERDKYQDDIMVSEKQYYLMRFWEAAFSEKGLVRYIVRNILGYLNDCVNTYLGVISNNIFYLEFNDMLEETVLKDGKVKPYSSLSGGEKRRVSLSVMLALNDLLLLTGKDNSNIVFFDEVADSLDQVGVIGLFNLIKSQSDKKKIFIITHNELLESLLKDESDEVLVVKEGDITTISIP